jgi:hypothetical protein
MEEARTDGPEAAVCDARTPAIGASVFGTTGILRCSPKYRVAVAPLQGAMTLRWIDSVSTAVLTQTSTIQGRIRMTSKLWTLGVLASSVVFSTISHADVLCFNKKTKALTVAASCKAGFKSFTLPAASTGSQQTGQNQQSTPGAQGPQGQHGPSGPAGEGVLNVFDAIPQHPPIGLATVQVPPIDDSVSVFNKELNVTFTIGADGKPVGYDFYKIPVYFADSDCSGPAYLLRRPPLVVANKPAVVASFNGYVVRPKGTDLVAGTTIVRYLNASNVCTAYTHPANPGLFPQWLDAFATIDGVVSTTVTNFEHMGGVATCSTDPASTEFHDGGDRCWKDRASFDHADAAYHAVLADFNTQGDPLVPFIEIPLNTLALPLSVH